MENVGIELLAKNLRSMANDLDEWNKRTNDSARSPQEPVVQSACNQTTLPEQTGAVVQDGMEPSDRKALSVQSAATIAFSVDEWRAFASVMRDLTWGKNCGDVWHYRVRASMDAKAAQVEQEAKRAAAD